METGNETILSCHRLRVCSFQGSISRQDMRELLGADSVTLVRRRTDSFRCRLSPAMKGIGFFLVANCLLRTLGWILYCTRYRPYPLPQPRRTYQKQGQHCFLLHQLNRSRSRAHSFLAQIPENRTYRISKVARDAGPRRLEVQQSWPGRMRKVAQ